MNKLIIIFSLIFSFIPLYSQNFDLSNYEYNGWYPTFSFFLKDSSNAELITDDTSLHSNYKYSLEQKSGMSYIVLDKDIPGNLGTQTDNRKYLKADNILFLAGIDPKTDTRYCIGYTSLFLPNPFLLNFKRFQGTLRVYKNCTSFLKEKKKTYNVENLCNIDDSTPWVENVPGEGIGESFEIENSWGDIYTSLLIINGYISYDKPWLYKENNRIKSIRVTGIKTGNTRILNVLDTPHPQTVDISYITEPEDIKVEIIDVFKGTKYDDTCIQYMITWDHEIIPYENEVH